MNTLVRRTRVRIILLRVLLGRPVSVRYIRKTVGQAPGPGTGERWHRGQRRRRGGRVSGERESRRRRRNAHASLLGRDLADADRPVQS